MKKYIFLLAALILACGLNAQTGSKSASKSSQIKLKKLCLSSTIIAIQLEMNNYLRWIEVRKKENKPKEAADFQKTLDSLKIQLKKYQAMDAKDYVLPENSVPDFGIFTGVFKPGRITTTAWVEGPAGKDDILYVKGMSRNGPWYHLAGIVGNDFSVLKPKVKYHVTFYAIWKRNYWIMPSAYVCVTRIKGK